MSAKQHYNKMVAQGKVGRGGRLVTPIDKKRFPNREKEGLEGPFRSRKSGQVYYYDKKSRQVLRPIVRHVLQVKDVMENTASNLTILMSISPTRRTTDVFQTTTKQSYNDKNHPMNQKLNEEKQFKARIAFMGEPRDNARDMRAAARMGMYDTATERDVPSKRKSTVFDITFKSERQFNQFMGAYDVEFLDRLELKAVTILTTPICKWLHKMTAF